MPASAKPGAMPAEAEAGWWHFHGMLRREALERDLAAASDAFVDEPTGANESRLTGLKRALDALHADIQQDAVQGGEEAA